MANVRSDAPVLRPADIADGAARVELRPDGSVAAALAFVALKGASRNELQAASEVLRNSRSMILVGLGVAPPMDLASHLSVTLVPAEESPLARTCVPVSDLDGEVARICDAVRANPRAALSLRDLLQITASLDSVRDGLTAESFAYSMLLAGAEFARWRAARPRRQVRSDPSDPVLVERVHDLVDIRLNRPERRNSFSREVRDAMLDALLLPAVDPSIERIRISGRGPSFCSGGDLDEFGATADVALAHQVRTAQAVGWAIHRLRDRTTVLLHGACIGAGIELPAFAGTVLARPDVSIRLPELSMGLVPGAGGTVSLTRRIGRWRTEYLALSGAPIGLETALAWGLVDGVA